MPSYKVIGGAPINHNGNLYNPGDTVDDIPAHVALQLRWQLEPTNEADAFPETVSEQNLGQMPGHERLGFLEEKQRNLQLELDKVGDELEKTRTEVNSQIEMRRNAAPDNAQGTVENINTGGAKPAVQTQPLEGQGVAVKSGGAANRPAPAAAPPKK